MSAVQEAVPLADEDTTRRRRSFRLQRTGRRTAWRAVKVLVAWPVIFVTAVVLHTVVEVLFNINVTVFWWGLIDLVLLPVSAFLAVAMVEHEHAHPGRGKRGLKFWAQFFSLALIGTWVLVWLSRL